MPKNSDATVYAFIDSQNLNLGIRELGWKLDFKRFRIYLSEKYGVEKAIIVSGDGDFQCLAKYLYERGKLGALLVPNQKKYSALLKFDIFKPHLRFTSDLQNKLEYIPKKKNLRKDGTLKRKTSIGDTKNIAKNDAKVKLASQPKKRKAS